MDLSDFAKVQVVRIIEDLLEDQYVNANTVLKQLSKKTGVPSLRIQSESRDKRASTIRYMAAYVFMTRFGMSSVETGAHLKRDHSTILFGYNKIRRYVDYVNDHPELRTISFQQNPLPLFDAQKDDCRELSNAILTSFGPTYGNLTGTCILMDQNGNAYFPVGGDSLRGLQRIKDSKSIRATVNLETCTLTLH